MGVFRVIGEMGVRQEKLAQGVFERRKRKGAEREVDRQCFFLGMCKDPGTRSEMQNLRNERMCVSPNKNGGESDVDGLLGERKDR